MCCLGGCSSSSESPWLSLLSAVLLGKPLEDWLIILLKRLSWLCKAEKKASLAASDRRSLSPLFLSCHPMPVGGQGKWRGFLRCTLPQCCFLFWGGGAKGCVRKTESTEQQLFCKPGSGVRWAASKAAPAFGWQVPHDLVCFPSWTFGRRGILCCLLWHLGAQSMTAPSHCPGALPGRAPGSFSS